MAHKFTMRYCVAIVLALFASPTGAQERPKTQDEHRAYQVLSKCVLYAAGKFAKLDDTVDGLAEATMAACQVEFRLFSDAIDKSRPEDVRATMLTKATEEMRDLAIRTVAGIRLR
ncbi:hypothetical protein [Rhizobium sp. NFR07]|uniref:hypothetical protein n=1 Tax=Rhizobium sp. NFR07 TaxID=1566262 RepID=UPI0011607A20|nr:hypothetical protein [Rhizobium sp. NFR07]